MYGAVIEIAANQKLAEEILAETFSKTHHQNLDEQTKASACISLIKLLIKTAYELLPEGQEPNYLNPDQHFTYSFANRFPLKIIAKKKYQQGRGTKKYPG